MTSIFITIDILQCYVITVRFASSELIESNMACDHDAAFANVITFIVTSWIQLYMFTVYLRIAHSLSIEYCWRMLFVVHFHFIDKCRAHEKMFAVSVW